MRKNKKDKKQDINYLDLIPETNQSIRWHRDLKQRIILEIENKGMFNTIAQKVFGKPRFSKVKTDCERHYRDTEDLKADCKEYTYKYKSPWKVSAHDSLNDHLHKLSLRSRDLCCTVAPCCIQKIQNTADSNRSLPSDLPERNHHDRWYRSWIT